MNVPVSSHYFTVQEPSMAPTFFSVVVEVFSAALEVLPLLPRRLPLVPEMLPIWLFG